jgi:glutathione synthase/RimK-type ligase-like ATP-grasp enzyme
MIKKVLKDKKYRLLRKWEVTVVEINRNTYVVSANNKWEAMDNMESMKKPTFTESIDSVVEVVKKINYS